MTGKRLVSTHRMGHLIYLIIECLLCVVCPLVCIHMGQKYFHSGPFPTRSMHTSIHNSLLSIFESFIFQPWTTGQPVRHSQGGIYIIYINSSFFFFFQAKQTTPCFKFCPLGRFFFTTVLRDDMYWILILCTTSDSLEPPLILLAPYQCWVTTPYTHCPIWMSHHAAGHGIQISEQLL